MAEYKRLQGKRWANMKDKLKPVAYAETHNGNICVYYEGDYIHYLSTIEKKSFRKKSVPKIVPVYPGHAKKEV